MEVRDYELRDAACARLPPDLQCLYDTRLQGAELQEQAALTSACEAKMALDRWMLHKDQKIKAGWFEGRTFSFLFQNDVRERQEYVRWVIALPWPDDNFKNMQKWFKHVLYMKESIRLAALTYSRAHEAKRRLLEMDASEIRKLTAAGQIEHLPKEVYLHVINSLDDLQTFEALRSTSKSLRSAIAREDIVRAVYTLAYDQNNVWKPFWWRRREYVCRVLCIHPAQCIRTRLSFV